MTLSELKNAITHSQRLMNVPLIETFRISTMGTNPSHLRIDTATAHSWVNNSDDATVLLDIKDAETIIEHLIHKSTNIGQLIIVAENIYPKLGLDI